MAIRSSSASTRIRLEGIDAPEAGQTCKRRWLGTWACGTAATGALDAPRAGQAGAMRTARSRQVRAHARGLLPRPAGCQRAGWCARACLGLRQILHELREGRGGAQSRGASASGRARRRPAWEYRAQRWASAEPQAPQGCAIKGNVTAHGKIYHMPWSPWYAQIRMNPDKGRRWFCTEAEAVAAGWRPVNLH